MKVKIKPFFIFLFFYFFILTSGYSRYDLALDGTEAVILSPHQFATKTLSVIRNAKSNIQLCLSVVDYSEEKGHLPTKLLQAIVEKANEGIDIEIIINRGQGKNFGTVNQKAWNFLYENGLKVYNDSKENLTLTTFIVVDDFTAIVGTSSWTKKSMMQDNHLNVWIESLDFCTSLKTRFEFLRAQGVVE